MNKVVKFIAVILSIALMKCDSPASELTQSMYKGNWVRIIGASGDRTDLAIGTIKNEIDRVWMCEKKGSTAAGLYKGRINGDVITWDASHKLPDTHLSFKDNQLEFDYRCCNTLPTYYSKGEWSDECGSLEEPVPGAKPTPDPSGESEFKGNWVRVLGHSGDRTDLAIGTLVGERSRVWMCELKGSTAAGSYKGTISGNVITWDAIHNLPKTYLSLRNGQLEFDYKCCGTEPTFYTRGNWSNECGFLEKWETNIAFIRDDVNLEYFIINEVKMDGQPVKLSIRAASSIPTFDISNVEECKHRPSIRLTEPTKMGYINGEYLKYWDLYIDYTLYNTMEYRNKRVTIKLPAPAFLVKECTNALIFDDDDPPRIWVGWENK